jgi:hypothetical protein
VVIPNLVENLDGVIDRISLGPFDIAVAARVVKAVLRSLGCIELDVGTSLGTCSLTTVEIDHNLQASSLGPVKRLSQHVVRALNVGLSLDW